MGARLEFHGVRGSIATPGAETIRTGGNTSCAELRMGAERIILDGGTGLRRLGAMQGAIPLEQRARRQHTDTWAAREGKAHSPAERAQEHSMQRALESYLATALATG